MAAASPATKKRNCFSYLICTGDKIQYMTQKTIDRISKLNTRTKLTMHISYHFELLAFISAAAVLAADLAKREGFMTLFGLSAFLILRTAHAVPIACPAASSPSFVTLAASSPYLHKDKHNSLSSSLQITAA